MFMSTEVQGLKFIYTVNNNNLMQPNMNIDCKIKIKVINEFQYFMHSGPLVEDMLSLPLL